MPARRYPGIRPFETSECHLFFGRHRDIGDLSVLVQLEKLVVLFGRSGYGKSSLINAGLLPLLALQSGQAENPVQPLLVRFGSYSDSANRSPVEVLLGRLDEIFPYSRAHFLDTLAPERNLWYHFKKRQQPGDAGQAARYLLIFDQFEEFFSYPAEQQEALKTQLAELVYTDIPQTVRAKSALFAKTQWQALAEPLDVRVLFSIRADRINLLHGFGAKFPAILDKRNRYELRGLRPDQAEAAIAGPAGESGDFESPPFSYSQAALDTILQKLSENRQATSGYVGIETSQLQVLCEYLESAIIAGHIPGNCIEPDHFVGQFEAIYEGYYRRMLEKLPEAERPAARRVLEQGLLLVDAQTGEARRLSRDAGELAQAYAVEPGVLQNLEQSYLIRREANSLGGYHYEISHDILLAPMLKARREAEAEAANARLQAEALALAEQERRLRRRQRRNALVGLTAFCLLALSALSLLWAQQSQKKADVAARTAGKYERQAQQSAGKAQLENQNARAARQTADSLAVVALQKNAAIELEQVKSARLSSALDLQRHFNIRFYLDQTRQNIDVNRFELAFEQFKIAVQSGASGKSVSETALELAFWYTETGQLARAFELLDMACQLAGKPPFKLPDNRQAARSAIRILDSAFEARLQARYFPVMVPVRGGTYLRGSDSIMVSQKRAVPDELPRHRVTVSDFKISQTEITFWQYNLYWMAADRPGFEPGVTAPIEGKGDHPVVNVNWRDAGEYANWLSARESIPPATVFEGRNRNKIVPQSAGYRLPSEAEWEFAARGGGPDTTLYAGGNDIDELAWHEKNSGQRTHPVRLKKSNGYGLFDMTGNVAEWCWDYYALDFYQTFAEKTATDPFGPAPEEKYKYAHVLKGGSFGDRDVNCRNATREGAPNYPYQHVGFRIVRR